MVTEDAAFRRVYLRYSCRRQVPLARNVHCWRKFWHKSSAGLKLNTCRCRATDNGKQTTDSRASWWRAVSGRRRNVKRSSCMGARRHLSVICALERLGTELTENGTLVKFCQDLWSWTPAVSPNLNPNQILCHRLDRDQSLHKIERIRQFPVPTMQHGVNTTFYSAPFCKRWICYGIFLSLSVRHTPLLCQSEGTQRDAVFTVG